MFNTLATVPDVIFWEQKYRDNDTPWDLKTLNPVLSYMIRQNYINKNGNILVLGSGKGYDAHYLAGEGFDVTAVDFSEMAIEQSKNINAGNGIKKPEFICADIFELNKHFGAEFDQVYEYVTFCAVLPEQREEMLRMVSLILRPGGTLNTVLFPVDGRPGGPPFSIDLKEFISTASPYIKLKILDKRINSVKPRKNKEVFLQFVRL